MRSVGDAVRTFGDASTKPARDTVGARALRALATRGNWIMCPEPASIVFGREAHLVVGVGAGGSLDGHGALRRLRRQGLGGGDVNGGGEGRHRCACEVKCGPKRIGPVFESPFVAEIASRDFLQLAPVSVLKGKKFSGGTVSAFSRVPFSVARFRRFGSLER